MPFTKCLLRIVFQVITSLLSLPFRLFLCRTDLLRLQEVVNGLPPRRHELLLRQIFGQVRIWKVGLLQHFTDQSIQFFECVD